MRGAWIEISVDTEPSNSGGSHPVRGAWIEIEQIAIERLKAASSHPVRGAWIEISRMRVNERSSLCRTP